MKLAAFAREPLLFGPSPVHPLERLSRHLGGADVWAKREDCNSGLAFGGNKTRKLEYLVADALAQGCDTLVSIGGVQSNHTRQVAAVAARTGMRCVLVQESWVDWPDPVYDKVGNILLSRILGADIRMVREGFGIGFKASWEQALEDVRAAGGNSVPNSRGRVRSPTWRPGIRALGPGGRRAGASARHLLRHGDRLFGDGQHAGGHDRRVRGPGSTPPCHRDRRVGEAHRNPRPGHADRSPDSLADRDRS